MTATIEQILWAFIIGITIACVYTFYTKRVLGGLIRAMIDHDALDAENALSLAEVGYDKNIFVRYALRKGTSFSETLLESGGKYYIPEDQLDKAENKYRNEGTSVFLMLLIVLAFAVVALICAYAFPQLFSMLEETF